MAASLDDCDRSALAEPWQTGHRLRSRRMELGDVGMAPWGRHRQATGPHEYPDLYARYDVGRRGARRDGRAAGLRVRRPLRYTHRRDGRADIYFVANPAGTRCVAQCSFRVTGKQPEIWDPMTGRCARSGRSRRRTGARGWVVAGAGRFGVRRVRHGQAAGQRRSTPQCREAALVIEIRRPWEVRFQPGLGAPEKITLRNLPTGPSTRTRA